MNFNKWIKAIRDPQKIIGKYKERKLLKKVSGIIHVGANKGQARDRYADLNLDVIWIEPIPNVYEQLVKNIEKYSNQSAFQALITDQDHKEYQFHIASNNGASSSILKPKEHKEMFRSVLFEKEISLKSLTLFSLIKQENIDMSKYQALVMDTQGSELLVLKGALSLIKHFKFIKTEVANFESYEDCCQLTDMNEFMVSNGFIEHHRSAFGYPTKSGGRYFDIIYTKPFD